MRVRVVIPTTGGPLLVRSLKPRAGLPSSAAFADGDYRPLAWSADYARLSAPGGPLSRLIPADRLVPHELRLDRGFDTGRSWEAPVALAHALLARGHAIAGPDETADLLLWATGALDLDLALTPGDYALVDKAEASRDLLARHAGEPVVAMLPPGRDREPAEAVLRGLLQGLRPEGSVVCLRATTLGTALTALEQHSVAALQLGPQADRERSRAWVAGIAALLLCLGLVAALRASGPGFLGGRLAEPPPPLPETGGRDPLAAGEAPPVRTAETAPAVAPVVAPARPILLAIDELHARPGSSCRRVVFGAEAPERRPVATARGNAFAPSRLAPDLCGLAFRPQAGAGGRVALAGGLAAASLPAIPQQDGSITMFLRGDLRQKVVYTAQVVGQDGRAETYSQELEP